MHNKDHVPEGNPHTIRVLMYHRVVDDLRIRRGDEFSVTRRALERQLALLERWGCTTITFDDYRLFLRGEVNLPRRPVILTFDDGYLDAYENAYPLLQKSGMKAVFFVLGDPSVRSNIWDRRRGIPEAPLMQRRHILELHDAGFEIGSHSLTHPMLTSVKENVAWEEISRSRVLLEFLLSAPVRSFAYPFGALNPMMKSMISDAGYDIACSVTTGPPTFSEDPFEIRRIAISQSVSAAGFAVRIFMPFSYFGWTRWKGASMLRRRTVRLPGPGDAANGADVHTSRWKHRDHHFAA